MAVAVDDPSGAKASLIAMESRGILSPLAVEAATLENERQALRVASLTELARPSETGAER